MQLEPYDYSGDARNGAIIVDHCGSAQTAAVLPDILRDLQGKGFKLVTVSEILRDRGVPAAGKAPYPAPV
jgi:peptidoglycan/xylan/chitin deacetylase (PgdA/CDA1 family)